MTGRPIPLGRDAASRNFAELISAIQATGEFGDPKMQSGSGGTEQLFRCPLCADDGEDTHGRMLRVARRYSDGDLPYVGCRKHETRTDWAALRAALVDAGVPARLLATRTGGGGSSGASGELGGFPTRPDGLGESEPIDEALVDLWYNQLYEPDGRQYLRYLRARGLTDDTIGRARLGLCHVRYKPNKPLMLKIAIPVFNAQGDCVNVRLSGISTGAKRLPYPHPKLLNEAGDAYLTYGTPARLYGLETLGLNVGLDELYSYVWVVGGEWDALLLRQAGWEAVSSTGGEGTLPRAEDAELLRGRDVIVCYDCDSAGRKGAAKFAQAVGSVAASARVLDLDADRDDGYDIGDLWKAHGEDGAVEELINALSAAPMLGPVDAVDDLLSRIPSNDTEAAEYLHDKHDGDMRYIATGPRSGYWIVWNGKRWIVDADGIVERRIKEIHRDFLPDALAAYKTAQENDSGIGAAGDLLRTVRSMGNQNRIISILNNAKTSHPGITLAPTLLDADTDRLATLNGVLHLGVSGAKLEEVNQSALLTMNTNVRYLMDAEDDHWYAALDLFVPDPGMEDFLARAFGYAMLGGNPEGLIFLLKGPSNTGKSTILEAVAGALGDYAAPFDLSALRGKQGGGPREDIADVMEARLAYVSEINGRWELHADQMKRLTGSERLSYNRKYESQVRAMPKFTAFIGTNNQPRVTGADGALKNRLVTIPFEHAVARKTGKARVLSADPVQESILAWIVAGYDRYCEIGLGPETWPKAVLQASVGVRDALDQYDDFIRECCRVGPDYAAPGRYFWPAYTYWARDEEGISNNNVGTKSAFYESLNSKGFVLGPAWVDGKTEKCRLGIKLEKRAEGWAESAFDNNK